MGIDDLLAALDGSGSTSEWHAVAELRKRDDFPALLLRKFRSARAWKARSSCVFHAIRYGRESDDAIAIGKGALTDRAKVVRYRGCSLLAFSLRKEVLPVLRDALAGTRDVEGIADLKAAIDAIESGNHNLFLDRDHTGMVVWEVR